MILNKIYMILIILKDCNIFCGKILQSTIILQLKGSAIGIVLAGAGLVSAGTGLVTEDPTGLAGFGETVPEGLTAGFVPVGCPLTDGNVGIAPVVDCVLLALESIGAVGVGAAAGASSGTGTERRRT